MAYALLVVSALLFGLALNLPVGAMPLALTADGASRGAVAVAMGAGMFAALFGSLPIGALADRIGRLATIRVAAIAGVGALFALSFVHGLAGDALLLSVRSLALVAYMTAEFAYASELVSGERAVSGVATIGMVGNLTFAIGPALGVFLWQHGLGRAQFTYGGAVGLLALGSLLALPKRHDVHSAAPARPLALKRAWLPAMAFAAGSALVGGVNGSLAVLTFHERGIVNGAIVFTAMALTSFALRYPAGRLVDRLGPRAIALPTALLQAGGALLAAAAYSLGGVICAGILLGGAWAAVVPVTVGLLFEHSSSETRGAAMGAYNLAFSGGAACGAVLATLATLLGGGYGVAMSACALASVISVPLVLRSPAPQRREFFAVAGAAAGD